MEALEIKIASAFSSTPGPRYKIEGENSGEEFRESVLRVIINKAVENNAKIIVDLDGTAGFGTSFLEESFGGLIRIDKFDYSKIDKLLFIISNEEPYLIDDIKQYLLEAHEES